MSGDANSDTLEYRPSFRTLVESNYWSEDNCCMSKSNLNNINWPALENNSTEEKNIIMADTDVTSKNDEIKNDTNNNNRFVHFNESMNQSIVGNDENINNNNNNNNNNNFPPGSNISPSLLNDNVSIQNDSNVKNTQLSGKKRTDSEQQQNDEINSPPSAKRMRHLQNENININDDENMNNDLSFQDELT